MATPPATDARLVAAAAHAGAAEIKLAARTTIGRSPDSDVCIDDPKISRLHAVITMQDAEVVVEDMHSTNGTWVNEQRIHQPTPIHDGDSIRFQNYGYQLRVTTIPFEESADVSTDAPDQLRQPDFAIAADEQDAAGPSGQSSDVGERLPGSWINADSARLTRVLDGPSDAAADMPQELQAALASRLADRPHLVAVGKDGASEVFSLATSDGRDVWDIGRDANCQIVLDEPSVSGKHAQLVHERGSWRLVNLVSANGSLVNGERCLDAFLADGDVLDLGLVKLAFYVGDDAAGANEGGQGVGRSPAEAKRKGAFILPLVLLLGLVGLALLWISGRGAALLEAVADFVR